VLLSYSNLTPKCSFVGRFNTIIIYALLGLTFRATLYILSA